MKFSLFNTIFNKKLIKGFPPCTDCPDPNSDCGQPCGCGDGGDGGCGGGGGSGGGQGGGSGGMPRGAQNFQAAPGSNTEEVSIEIFDDPNFAENISSEVEEFLAVGQSAGSGPLIPSTSNDVKPGDIGGGKSCGGCGGCGGGGGGGGLGFGGSIMNPGINYTSAGGGLSVTVTPYGTPSDGKSNIFCFTWNY
jgi:hypothetical protein